MFEDVREAVRKARERGRKWKAFHEEHGDEFKEKVRPLNIRIIETTALWIAFGSLLIAGQFFIFGVVFWTPILIIILLWVISFLKFVGKYERTEREILRRHHYECPYCGQPMQERALDFPPESTWDASSPLDDIIIEEPTESDYDFVHLPQEKE